MAPGGPNQIHSHKAKLPHRGNSFADKILTQAAPDICRKLQKLALGPEGTLDQLLKVADSVFYNQNQEEAQDKERKIRKKGEVLLAALQGARGKPDCHRCGQSSLWRRECPRQPEPTQRPPQPCPICKGDRWKSDCPWRPLPPRPALSNQTPTWD